MRTWFITGGTPGGFGMAYAEAALARGDRVALTVRRPDDLIPWAAAHGDRALVLPLDVTDPVQVSEAVETAERHFGGIDVLANNAGRGWYGSVEGMGEAAWGTRRSPANWRGPSPTSERTKASPEERTSPNTADGTTGTSFTPPCGFGTMST